jgi:hypothetical protein
VSRGCCAAAVRASPQRTGRVKRKFSRGIRNLTTIL